MYRQSITRAVRPAFQSRAAFSTSIRAMAGGDTGAPRTGGVASGYVLNALFASAWEFELIRCVLL